MKLKTTKSLSLQSLFLISVVIVFVAIYANIQTSFHDPKYSLSVYFLSFVVKNSFNIISSILIVFLTLKLIHMHFKNKILNYQKFLIGKNRILKIFFILVVLTPIFTFDIVDYPVLIDRIISEKVFRSIYFLQITVLSLSLLSIATSFLVIKKVTGEKLMMEREIIIEHLYSELESYNEIFESLLLSSKIVSLNFEIKVKEFISRTNKRRITRLKSHNADLLALQKKGTCPPLFFL